MLLRRLSKHVNDQNWFAVGLDFFIVVVGVFVGLQVSNWSNARQDRHDETEIIHDLHAEIVETEKLAANILSSRTNDGNNIAAATNILFGLAPYRELTAPECNTLGLTALYFGRAKLPALERLQATGRLNIVRDPALNRALANLIQRYEALDLVSKIEESIYVLVYKHPNLFKTSSVLEASETRIDLERTTTTQCKAAEIQNSQIALNAIAFNADAYDAFMRDGLRPWVAQVQEVHRQLDVTLNIQHETAK